VERAPAVVVGLGAMGSAAALSLGRRGVETIALERFRVGHARGSSHGPTRIFRLSYPEADYVRMAQSVLPMWRDLERDAGEQLLVTTGGLDVGPLARECAEALTQCGAPHEWIDVADRFPGIAADGPALFQPDAGVSLAGRTVVAQVRLAREAGVDVREETEVIALRPREDGVAVDTTAGPIEAEVVVVTTGAWASRLLSDVPVEPHLQTVGYFLPSDPAAGWPTFIEWAEGGFAWYEVPAAGDAPGVKVAEHRPGPIVDPARGPFDPDSAAIEATVEYVRRRFPGLDPGPVAAETCLYEVTPDEHFVIDRTGPIVVGTGGSGHAFKFTPLLGEMLADLAAGRDPRVPVDRFGFARFAT